MCIEYANLQEQASRNNDAILHGLLEKFTDVITITEKNQNKKIYTIDAKEIIVFDDVLSNTDIEHLNNYCLDSVYKPGHRSDRLNYTKDSRFVSQLSDNDLTTSKVVDYIQRISSQLNLRLHVGNGYINHYGVLTSVSRHTDSSEEHQYTVLFSCNKYWEPTWGGELAFYKDFDIDHTVFEYRPGRVWLFDSRISHKVMPININAQADRYTLAVKCATDPGLAKLKEIYPSKESVKNETVS
jgi:Rps23 Pro-64 3,4-dihydroxylase Tpa1-like proline 4-hydroxylase